MTLDEAYAEANQIYGVDHDWHGMLMIQVNRYDGTFGASISGMAKDVSAKTRSRYPTASEALDAVIHIARKMVEIEG